MEQLDFESLLFLLLFPESLPPFRDLDASPIPRILLI